MSGRKAGAEKDAGFGNFHTSVFYSTLFNQLKAKRPSVGYCSVSLLMSYVLLLEDKGILRPNLSAYVSYVAYGQKPICMFYLYSYK